MDDDLIVCFGTVATQTRGLTITKLEPASAASLSKVVIQRADSLELIARDYITQAIDKVFYSSPDTENNLMLIYRYRAVRLDGRGGGYEAAFLGLRFDRPTPCLDAIWQFLQLLLSESDFNEDFARSLVYNAEKKPPPISRKHPRLYPVVVLKSEVEKFTEAVDELVASSGATLKDRILGFAVPLNAHEAADEIGRIAEFHFDENQPLRESADVGKNHQLYSSPSTPDVPAHPIEVHSTFAVEASESPKVHVKDFEEFALSSPKQSVEASLRELQETTRTLAAQQDSLHQRINTLFYVLIFLSFVFSLLFLFLVVS